MTCDECGRDIDPEWAAPSCGAHYLHQECSAYFHCRQCDHYRTDATC